MTKLFTENTAFCKNPVPTGVLDSAALEIYNPYVCK